MRSFIFGTLLGLGLGLGFLAGAAPSARADWAYTTWGMSPEQVAAAASSAAKGAVTVIPEGERKTVAGANMRTGAEGSFFDGPIALRVAFSFDAAKGGLNCVLYSVEDEKQSAALMDLMVKRFGEPVGKTALPTIGMTTLNWTKPDEIMLQMVANTPAFVSQCRGR